jgi:transcription factor E
MLKNFFRDAIAVIVGKPSENIADLLYSKNPVNEFLIAKKLGLTINQTRNLLYRISEQGLVSSIRKKDKKKGWYTYFWKLEPIKCLEFLKKILIKKIEQTNSQINSRQTKRFYVCERCNLEFNEENALFYDFTCRECGNVFKLKDNSKLLRALKKNLTKSKNELQEIEKEIEKEEEKEEKRKIKELNKKKLEISRKKKTVKKTKSKDKKDKKIKKKKEKIKKKPKEKSLKKSKKMKSKNKPKKSAISKKKSKPIIKKKKTKKTVSKNKKLKKLK